MHKIKIYVLGDLFAYSKIYFKILKRINLNSFFNNFSGEVIKTKYRKCFLMTKCIFLVYLLKQFNG